MTPYEFHAETARGGEPILLRQVLRCDIEASVRTFDLLRDHPKFAVVTVFSEGRQILRRTRAAGKIQLTWACGFPRSTQLHATRRRRRGQTVPLPSGGSILRSHSAGAQG